MLVGNCYTFAVTRYVRDGGWIVLRRSVKFWGPHMQWGAAGLEMGAEPMPSWWAGLKRIMGPDRGYLLWSRKGSYWRPRIHALQIVEYLPPPWIDHLISNYWIFRKVPLHALVFVGWVRAGEGEQSTTQHIIDKTWPGRVRSGEP